MAPWREIVQLHMHAMAIEFVQLTWRLVVNLHHDMGPKTQFQVSADGPVLHLQDEINAVGVNHAVVCWGDESKIRLISLQVFTQLLHPPRGGNLL